MPPNIPPRPQPKPGGPFGQQNKTPAAAGAQGTSTGPKASTIGADLAARILAAGQAGGDYRYLSTGSYLVRLGLVTTGEKTKPDVQGDKYVVQDVVVVAAGDGSVDPVGAERSLFFDLSQTRSGDLTTRGRIQSQTMCALYAAAAGMPVSELSVGALLNMVNTPDAFTKNGDIFVYVTATEIQAKGKTITKYTFDAYTEVADGQ